MEQNSVSCKKKISLCPRVGICKCVYKHSLLGELNVTLEIVFSNQIYVATAVDSVYGVCISPIYIRATPGHGDQRVLQEGVSGEAGKGVSVFTRTFVQGRQIAS